MSTTTSASTAELARLSELIDSIYQGATNPAHWDVALPAIADWVGASKGLLFTPVNAPDNGGFYFNHAIPEQTMQLWGTRYIKHDAWAERMAECGLISEGCVSVSDDYLSFEELSRTEFYQDFLSKIDIAHQLGGIVFGMEAPQANPVVACALFRGLEHGRFTTIERDRLAILMPHLSRSLGVMTRLRNLELKTAAGLSALDRLTAGVLLFGARGQITFANRAARNILEEEDGLQLQHRFGDSSLGTVIAEDTRANTELECAIRNAISPDILHAQHFSRAVAVSRPSGRQDYTLNFSSLAEHNEFGLGSDAPRAIAFITDSAEPIKLDGALLKTTYGLTPAEIRLAETLAECLTVEETAERLGISRSTVKAQQQSIYAKTNTNSRAKLMRLIMSLSQVAR